MQNEVDAKPNSSRFQTADSKPDHTRYQKKQISQEKMTNQQPLSLQTQKSSTGD